MFQQSGLIGLKLFIVIASRGRLQHKLAIKCVKSNTVSNSWYHYGSKEVDNIVIFDIEKMSKEQISPMENKTQPLNQENVSKVLTAIL